MLLGACATLLGDLRPATACGLVLGGAGGVAVVNDALVSELATAKEFLGEVTGVQCVTSGVDGLGDEFSISGEAQEGRDEILSYK